MAHWSYQGGETHQGEWISEESSIEAQNVNPGTPHQYDRSAGGTSTSRGQLSTVDLTMSLAEGFFATSKGTLSS